MGSLGKKKKEAALKLVRFLNEEVRRGHGFIFRGQRSQEVFETFEVLRDIFQSLPEPKSRRKTTFSRREMLRQLDIVWTESWAMSWGGQLAEEPLDYRFTGQMRMYLEDSAEDSFVGI